MKVIEDVQDKYGNYCIIFKSTNLRLIYDWLHTHYSGNGFKFAIVIDLSIDYGLLPGRDHRRSAGLCRIEAYKCRCNIKAETAAESRCLPELVYRH